MAALGIGMQLTVFGMGLVFLLLAVMAFLISVLVRMDTATPSRMEAPAPRYPAGLDAETLSAVTVAVVTHLAVRRKEAAPAMREHQPGTLPSRWVVVGRTLQNSNWQPGRRNP